MEVSPEVLNQTKTLLEQIISKPKLTEKHLSRPPFTFLHDIISNTISSVGFAKDLFSQDELDKEKASSSKENKISFLEKIIKYVCEKTGQQLLVKSAKIIAGLEPEQTNIFLQALANAAKPTTKPKQEATPEKVKKKKKETPDTDKSGKQTKSAETKKTTKSEKNTDEKKTSKKSSKKEKEGGKKKDKEKKKSEKPQKEGSKEINPISNSEPTPTNTIQEKKEDLGMKSLSLEKREPEFGDIVRNNSLERPKTAAKPPPKLRDSANAVEKISVETAVATAVNSTILSEGHQEEEQQIMNEDEDDEQKPNLGESVDLDDLSKDGHGVLVRDILATNQQETPKRESTKMEVLANKHQKELLQKEVAKLREQIQVVCRSANPLGKIVDFFQEDFDNMNKELEKWKTESISQQVRLKEEQRTTEASLAPLNQKLLDLDQVIADIMQKIHVRKTSISRNDETITKMLSPVTAS